MSQTIAPAMVAAFAGLMALMVRTPGVTAVAAMLVVGSIGLSKLSLKSREIILDQRWLVRWIACVAIGGAAFYAARVFGPAAPVATTALAFLANGLAAVCEEAFFRRFLYSWLEPLGPLVAVMVTAILFALIHVPAYGWPIVPIDFAAGLLLGWQRWASGHWSAPATTHLFANLITMV